MTFWGWCAIIIIGIIQGNSEDFSMDANINTSINMSKDSKFYITSEEILKRMGKRTIKVLSFDRIMPLMVEYPNRWDNIHVTYYFSVICEEVNILGELSFYTYRLGFKNKNGDIIFKKFIFTDKGEEYKSFKRAIAWYTTNVNSRDGFYRITIEDESGDGGLFNFTTMAKVDYWDYKKQVIDAYEEIYKENHKSFVVTI